MISEHINKAYLTFLFLKANARGIKDAPITINNISMNLLNIQPRIQFQQ